MHVIKWTFSNYDINHTFLMVHI